MAPVVPSPLRVLLGFLGFTQDDSAAPLGCLSNEEIDAL
jgi:hypothetical protein